MSKEQVIPVFGQPIFRISENLLSDRVKLSGELGLRNGLTYFAHDAIMVMSLKYEDQNMKKVIINEGMVSEDDNSKSLEIHIDLRSKEVTYFVNEADAMREAKQMNINQQKYCKQLVDAAVMEFNEYDKIIAACTIK